jgi:hypothetical protein
MRVNVRQGDLLFIPITNLAEEVSLSDERKVKNGVIAEGEATGHHHRVAEADLAEAEIYRHWNGQMYMRVSEKGISIVHEEHNTVTLEPGEYTVHRAREFDYLQSVSRYVAD